MSKYNWEKAKCIRLREKESSIAEFHKLEQASGSPRGLLNHRFLGNIPRISDSGELG